MRAVREFQLDPGLAFGSAVFSDLIGRWTAAREASGAALPPREFADPFELREHLGYLQLVDVVHDPVRFRYRLIGTRITALAGRDSTGRWFQDLYSPQFLDEAFKTYRWVVAEKQPLRVSATWQHVDKGHIRYEALDLPLSADGRTVDLILTRMAFENVA